METDPMTTVEIGTEPLRTIVKRKFCPEYVRAQLELGVPVVVIIDDGRFTTPVILLDWEERGFFMTSSSRIYPHQITHTIVTLPPLPRYRSKHPTPDERQLVHLYAAHGLDVMQRAPDGAVNHILGDYSYWGKDFPITHAQLADGTRVDVAIQD